MDPLRFEPNPIDWSAYWDPEGPIGHGKTKAKALSDLFDQCDDADGHAQDMLAGAIVAALERREEYDRANPLGGPASMFRAMAERIEAGEAYAAVLADYGVTVGAPPSDFSSNQRPATMAGATSEAATPPGWKLVPEIATDRMVSAFTRSRMPSNIALTPHRAFQHQYEAMLREVPDVPTNCRENALREAAQVVVNHRLIEAQVEGSDIHALDKVLHPECYESPARGGSEPAMKFTREDGPEADFYAALEKP